MSSSKERIPVTVIGGFLGAGKTTLVNHILDSAEGRRLVIFVNDFGEINIDLEFIETVEEDRIALTNGCVCCTLNDDLIAGITDYTKREQQVDGFIIESSGISDPRQLGTSLTLLEQAGIARLDATIYVFDAYTFPQLTYEDQEAVIDHACHADLILLNKVDIVKPTTVSDTMDLLSESAPYSTLIKSQHCAVARDILFGDSIKRDDALHRVDSRAARKSDHITRFSSFSIASDKPVDRIKFKQFVDILHQLCIRAKGLVVFGGDADKGYTFNLIGNRATLEQRTPGSNTIATELVFIGERSVLDESIIKANFSLCI